MRKLRNCAGYTLTEALVTIVLVLLVTSAMATGVAFAVRQFDQSMTTSEAKVLQSTLAGVVENELAITNYVELGSTQSDGSRDVAKIFSRHYAVNEGYCEFHVIDDDSNGYGELALGANGNWKRLISSASYDFGAGADIRVTYFEGDGATPAHFRVDLSIGNRDGEQISSTTFDVVPLNDPDVRYV